MEPTLSAVFGPERATYLRLLYGTPNLPYSGITPGRFWDINVLPVPYTPRATTTFQLRTDIGTFTNSIGTITVISAASVASSAQTTAIINSPLSTFSIQLGKGLNKISVSVKGKVIASLSVTATTFASYVYTNATQIYNGTWQHINAISTDIYSEHPTILTTPLLGSIDYLFHHAQNINAMARGLVVNALMNFPASTPAIEALGQAMLHHTPILETKTPNFKLSWLHGILTQGWSVSGHTLHVWSPNQDCSRYPVSIATSASAGTLGWTTPTEAHLNEQEHYFGYLESAQLPAAPTRRRWLSMASSTDIVNLDFFAHNRYHAVVESPGLWDVKGSVFDSGLIFDTNRIFDLWAESLDPNRNGHVGTPLFAAKPFIYDPCLPVSSLDKDAETVDVALEPHLVTWSTVESIAWAYAIATTVATAGASTSSLNTAYTFMPTYITQPSSSSAPGLRLAFTTFKTDHAHTVTALTKAERDAVLAGTPYNGFTDYTGTGIARHRHAFTLSWADGWIVDITDNHGHLVTAEVLN